MRVFYCGFNAFEQWESSNSEHGFKEVSFDDLKSDDEIRILDVHIGWAHNLILLNSKVFIKGFHMDATGCQELMNPKNESMNKFVSNDEFILLYNNQNTIVWKYYLDSDVEQKWKRLPDFVKVDCRISSIVTDDIDNQDEHILKIVSSDRMNIALTTAGRIFNIPYEIDNQCLGKIIDIECGYEHGILLTDLGNVYTWGGGSRCQLGHGDTQNYDEPVLVEALSGIKVTKIAAAGWHCCAISEFGDLYTWGWNEKGQLGVYISKENNEHFVIETEEENSNETSKLNPEYRNKLKKSNEKNSSVALPNYALPMLINIYDSEKDCVIENNVIDVSCGSKHTVIKLDDGSIWGTGCNKYNQLSFSSDEIENISNFRKLNVNLNDATIKCGTWATALITK